VVARDWIFILNWIVQDLLGGLSRMEESEIVQHPFMDEHNAEAHGRAMQPLVGKSGGAE